MSRYTDTKKMFREITSNDLEDVLVYLRLEMAKTTNYGVLLREEIDAGEAVLRERK